jgi:hypothetical protein
MTMDGQDVTRMVGSNDATRWHYQTVRDERLFRAGWFADFRQRWQRDLRAAREQFTQKMEDI